MGYDIKPDDCRLSGWTITGVEYDCKYVHLEKDGRKQVVAKSALLSLLFDPNAEVLSLPLSCFKTVRVEGPISFVPIPMPPGVTIISPDPQPNLIVE